MGSENFLTFPGLGLTRAGNNYPICKALYYIGKFVSLWLCFLNTRFTYYSGNSLSLCLRALFAICSGFTPQADSAFLSSLPHNLCKSSKQEHSHDQHTEDDSVHYAVSDGRQYIKLTHCVSHPALSPSLIHFLRQQIIIYVWKALAHSDSQSKRVIDCIIAQNGADSVFKHIKFWLFMLRY